MEQMPESFKCIASVAGEIERLFMEYKDSLCAIVDDRTYIDAVKKKEYLKGIIDTEVNFISTTTDGQVKEMMLRVAEDWMKTLNIYEECLKSEKPEGLAE